MKIGICGIGGFAPAFIPLFKAHPAVSEVVLADLIRQRAEDAARQFQISRVFSSLEELCASDVDAVVLLTQRHLHAPQAIAALKAGKHVYSAVPAGCSIEELTQLTEVVERTGLTYMTGETSYYYPSALYARDRFAKGDFGAFVYAEAQYLHDMDHFYPAYQHSGGPNWKRVAGLPPMYYPSHSLSLILSVTGAVATSVSCLGYRDEHHPDGIFGQGRNLWDNPFSNEMALLRTSDGGVIRINELRRVGWHGGNSVHMRLYGTEASFEENAISSCWVTKKREELTNLTELLACATHAEAPGQSAGGGMGEEYFVGVSKVHPVDRLPASFKRQRNGHYGSHQFLVDDFVQSILGGKLPPCHVWNSANWCAPGLIAHESALREGEVMKVPVFDLPRRFR